MKLLTTLFFVVLALSQTGMHETGNIHHLVTLTLKHYKSQMKQLQKEGFDIAGVDYDAKRVSIIADQRDLQKLEALSFSITDAQSVLAIRKPGKEFKTPAEVATILNDFAAKYPNLALVKSVGKSLEGRDILAVKITKDVAVADPAKPVIFFNGMHHARELMSVEVPLDTIETLLTGYGKDSAITHWVDANEIWLIPMLNVDGNNKVWTEDSMWRKNTRGESGVDINRNYPFQWNACHGSSGDPSNAAYRGPSPSSEPETNVMMNFVQSIRPVFSISYHSYSELVLYPYGCDGQYTETREVVEGIGKELASKLITDSGKKTYKPGTSPDILYSVDGGDIDWLYHEAQVIPYVIELNSTKQGFQPDYTAWRDSTVKRARAGWQFLLTRLEGSALHGKVTDQNGNVVKNAVLKIARVSSGNPFTQNFVAKNTGYFTAIVPPGQYTVTFEAAGMTSQTQNVNVGNQRVELSGLLKKL